MAQARVGWIGTGVMGKSMAGYLQKSQYGLSSVFNRTASKADELVAGGATFLPAKEVAQQCDFLFLMLGYPHDVERMVLDPEVGILKHMRAGSYLVDHTTSSPQLAIRIAEEAEKAGVHSVDAPVSGGDIGARNGALVTMVGGSQQAVADVTPLLDLYSKKVEHMGAPGTGQFTKAANQMMIANNMVGVCEALIFGHKAGVELDKMIELLKGGGAGSFSLADLGPRMLKRDFEPGFYVEHFVKDLGIVLEEARRMDLCVPGTAQATQLYQALKAQGGSRKGTQALIEALETLNNTQLKTYKY